MDNKITKQELIDWVDFLYQDLLNYQVYVGGFYFYFEQLLHFLDKKTQLSKKLNGVTDKNRPVSSDDREQVLKRLTVPSNLTKRKLKETPEFSAVKIKAINKYNEIVDLKITFDEFSYICDRLTYLFKEVENFNQFLMEEIPEIKEGDEGAFFLFVNDLLSDVKRQLKGEIKPVSKQLISKKAV